MGKKRKASRASAPAGPKEVDPADARLAINSFEDVADSADEYFLNQDRIAFDEAPKSKRQRREEEEDAFLEPSDEEIFAEDDSDENDDQHGKGAATKSKGSKSRGKNDDDSEDEEAEGDGEEEGDSGWWGSSKQDYYNADTIETEADALEEEKEALRLQKKKLTKMAEEDFMFDEGEWLAPAADKGEDADVVTEVLKDAEVTEDMGAEERYKILQARYPELDYLADELRELQPMLETLRKEADGQPAKSLRVVKFWLLSAYVGALASYFAILTSPARDGDGTKKTLDPAELRDHEIMETLVSCREAWLKVKSLKASKVTPGNTGMLSPPEEELQTAEEPVAYVKKTKEERAREKEAKARSRAKAKKAKEIEASIADLDNLLSKPKKASKSKSKSSSSLQATADDGDDNRSDFGEEEELDAKTSAAKEHKKKSLRFYTSQIVQKAARRAEATRDAGGDMDIPYRERLKDKQARLNAEAEKRGQKNSKLGAALEDNSSGEEDAGGANDDDDDEYYDLIANRASAKKADKAARHEALAAASKGERVVEQEEVGEDGKRKITYAIEKNKGLAPHRKKDVRNPRVKKRKKFEQKKKKLASMRPVYKGGEGPGGYQGELSGIKTSMVKSTKL